MTSRREVCARCDRTFDSEEVSVAEVAARDHGIRLLTSRCSIAYAPQRHDDGLFESMGMCAFCPYNNVLHQIAFSGATGEGSFGCKARARLS